MRSSNWQSQAAWELNSYFPSISTASSCSFIVWLIIYLLLPWKSIYKNIELLFSTWIGWGKSGRGARNYSQSIPGCWYRSTTCRYSFYIHTVTWTTFLKIIMMHLFLDMTLSLWRTCPHCPKELCCSRARSFAEQNN